MRTKKLIILLMLTFCITACAGLKTTVSPKYTYNFPFDVSKRHSKVSQEFKIEEYRSYYFAIRLDFFSREDKDRVFELIGDETLPGVYIPVYIKIYKLNVENLPPKLIYESSILTGGYYAHDYDCNRDRTVDECYFRKITIINLKPGLYRVEANTIKNCSEFAGRPSYLYIQSHPKQKFLLNAVF
ncbi:MAG: hypothetical protein JW976_13425 [Syntrophaceae bacterium]|nr:hypothetical protein [Syntrophaceae bacterium]